MLMDRPRQRANARRFFAVAVAANVQIIAWAVTMFLFARSAQGTAIGLLSAQTVLMIASTWYAVYLHGK